MFELKPVVLSGRHVVLEPAGPAHIDGMYEAGRHESIWQWMPSTIDSRAVVERLVAGAEAAAAAGTGLTFVTRAREEDVIVGSTAYLNVSPENGRLEIGYTWITPAWQRTAVNTEAKLLMLAHAFDVLGCVRVELKTDHLNERSRRAIARLGATEEGALRQHMKRRDGSYRDSVYFSILRDEWPDVERRLRDRLDETGIRRAPARP